MTLYDCIAIGDVNSARRLLLLGVDITDDVYMPLIAAVQNNQLVITRLLLIAGSDPAGDGAPLLSAVKNGNVAITKLLIAAGATLNTEYATFIANREGYTEIVHMLTQIASGVTSTRVPSSEP